MLIISEQDIYKAVNSAEIISAVEQAMLVYETGEFVMPLRNHIDYAGPGGEENTFLLMPCITESAVGAKLVTVQPGNTQAGRPVVNAMMTLFDAETGAPQALINGRALTALRTGAVGGAGVKAFAAGKPVSVGVVGAGVQGLQQSRFAVAGADVTELRMFNRTGEKVPPVLDALKQEYPELPVMQAESVEQLVAESDIIIAATSSPTPVLPDDEALLQGKSIVGVGSFKPAMREFPRAVFALTGDIYVDTMHAKVECGDLAEPLEKGWIREERIRGLGALLSGDATLSGSGLKLFKSVGMALFDVFVTQLIVSRAQESGLGLNVEM